MPRIRLATRVDMSVIYPDIPDDEAFKNIGGGGYTAEKRCRETGVIDPGLTAVCQKR